MQAVRERQQCTGEIAAVDGGDIAGRQRLERARVVPVQKMPVDLFQRFDRRQRRVDATDQRRCVDEAQIVSRECRQQAEADVGRVEGRGPRYRRMSRSTAMSRARRRANNRGPLASDRRAAAARVGSARMRSTVRWPTA